MQFSNVYNYKIAKLFSLLLHVLFGLAHDASRIINDYNIERDLYSEREMEENTIKRR